MSDWPIGLSTGCFSQDSIFDCLEIISREVLTLSRFAPSPRILTTTMRIWWLVPLAELRNSAWKLIRFMRHLLITLI